MADLQPAALEPSRITAQERLERRRAVRLLALATAMGSAGLAAGGTAGGLLAVEIAGTAAVAGLPIGALILGQAVAAILTSAVTRRSGRGLSLALGYLLGIGGAMIVSAAAVIDSLALLLVGSVILGGGNAAVFLARYAAHEVGGETMRGRAIGAVLFAAAVGAVASPNLLGPSSYLARMAGLPALTGLYLIAIFCFCAAGLLLAIASTRVLPHTQKSAALLGARLAASVSLNEIASGLGDRRAQISLLVLAVVNLAMVAIMAIAPVHLHRHGTALDTVGIIVAIHVAGMFGPSPLSGWLADRVGAGAVATVGALVLAAAGAAGSAFDMANLIAMSGMLLLLGIGWNFGIVGGSMLLVASVPAAVRPHAEGVGEVAMGMAAGAGALLAGLIVSIGGFMALCAVGGATAIAAVLALTLASKGRYA